MRVGSEVTEASQSLWLPRRAESSSTTGEERHTDDMDRRRRLAASIPAVGGVVSVAGSGLGLQTGVRQRLGDDASVQIGALVVNPVIRGVQRVRTFAPWPARRRSPPVPVPILAMPSRYCSRAGRRFSLRVLAGSRREDSPRVADLCHLEDPARRSSTLGTLDRTRNRRRSFWGGLLDAARSLIQVSSGGVPPATTAAPHLLPTVKVVPALQTRTKPSNRAATWPWTATRSFSM